jgi:hypothetical protein
VKAKFLPPRDNYSGNLLWNKSKFSDVSSKIESSLGKLREIGYWASAFPEGDGVTFNVTDETATKSNDEMFNDFRSAFDWVDIETAKSKDSNSELAELEDEDETLECIVIVPLDKIYIQKTLVLGNYTFVCRKEFDEECSERLADFEGEYLQFEVSLNYRDLLRLNESINHNDYVINKCLSLAEHAMDIVRFAHSSFLTREFTPNPAGQMGDGFYSVNIIPLGKTHLKPLELHCISKPISVSNNWLGPQVDDFFEPGIDYLSFIYSNNIDNEMAKAVISALRSCRQSFYSIGDESQFLNLVFVLDGLTDPEWSGWKHRTYIAALLSNNNALLFAKKLEEYDRLYTDVRNKLVHEGKDFYELSEQSNSACETIYEYIKDVIKLIAKIPLNTTEEMKNHATALLQTQSFKDEYESVINRVSASRGKQPRVTQW